MKVWMLARFEPNGSFEVNGIYSSEEKALAACTDDLTGAACFEMDRDYSDTTEFWMVSRAHPNGVMTDQRLAPQQDDAVVKPL